MKTVADKIVDALAVLLALLATLWLLVVISRASFGEIVPLPGNECVVASNQVVQIETSTDLQSWRRTCVASNDGTRQFMRYYRHDDTNRLHVITLSTVFSPPAPYPASNQRFWRAKVVSP